MKPVQFAGEWQIRYENVVPERGKRYTRRVQKAFQKWENRIDQLPDTWSSPRKASQGE